MKKRRTMIVALLLVAALCLGIGYAALSRELVISSTANLSPNDQNFEVVFISADVDKDELATASVTGTSTTANYTITGLSKVNDTVTMTFVIQNKTADIDANLKGYSTTAGDLYLGEGTATPGVVSDYFDKQIKIVKDADSSEFVEGTDFILEPSQTATVTVTVKLKQTITEKLTLTGASVYLDFEGNEA